MKKNTRILSFSEAKKHGHANSFHAGSAAYSNQVQQANNKGYVKPRSSLMMYLSQDDFKTPHTVKDPAWLNNLSKASSKSPVKVSPRRQPVQIAGTHAEAASQTALRQASSQENAISNAKVNPQAAEHNIQQKSSSAAGNKQAGSNKKITRAQRRQARKKAKAKQKAEKAFNAQFGGAESQSKPASRAAVYTGKLGAQQKRAQRMQEGKKPSVPVVVAPFAFIAGLLKNVKLNKRILYPCAVVCLCLVATVATLYQPAKTYYTSIRDYTKLEQEYEAIQNRNATMQQNVSSLQTVAGVQARAHEQLGWVQEGESSANVRGLNLEEEEAASSVVANVAPDDFTATETWYSPVLDVVFGYK